MTRTLALLFGVAVAIAAWLAAPLVRPELGHVWFVGAGDWSSVVLHGRDVISAFAGIAAWIVSLHLPRRGRSIAGIRIDRKATA